MKRRLLLLLLVGIIGIVIVYIITIPDNKKTINLINNYSIKKESDTSIKLVKDEKEIVTDYIAEYSYGKRYILLKCLDNTKGININFYIVDTKDNKVVGPYDYIEFSEIEIEEEVSEWIKTIEGE